MSLIGHYMYGITGVCINGNKIVPQEKHTMFHTLVSWHTKQIIKHRNIRLHHILLQADHSFMRDMHSQSH
jgi:hypothetical protein